MLVVGGKVGWRLVGDTWRIGHWWAAQSSPAWVERPRGWTGWSHQANKGGITNDISTIFKPASF